MDRSVPSMLYVAIGTAVLLGLPPLGVWLAGGDLGPYLRFPPLTRPVEHAGFSWIGFTALAVVSLAMLAPLLLVLARSPRGAARQIAGTSPTFHAFPAFPWWGWLGIGFTAVAWVLAWSRFQWFATLQPFTFSPQWLGYIVVINALTYRRAGHCMLLDRPRELGLLFLASAVLWWFFEYLNRFVQNWYYVGTETFGALEYAIYATLPFATVLPAVLGTKEWLMSFPRLQVTLRNFVPVKVRDPRRIGWITLLVAAAGLTGIGVWPDLLYPLLWVAPLLIITALQTISGRHTIFTPLRQGDWRPVYTAALAALICGVFWEMWNFYSVAKWVYTVPYVHRFQIFEMPLVGFGGYLPFGLECAVVGEMIAERARR